jgi:hypothetical protein
LEKQAEIVRDSPQKRPTFWKKTPTFLEKSPTFFMKRRTFFALARRDENEAALLVFHTKERRKQSSESTNLKMVFSRAHAHAHYSNFRVFAFTTFTEILATLSISIHSTHFSDIF